MSDRAQLGESIDALRAMVALRSSDGWKVLLARYEQIVTMLENERDDINRTDPQRAEWIRQILYNYRHALSPEKVAGEIISKVGSRANTAIKQKATP